MRLGRATALIVIGAATVLAGSLLVTGCGTTPDPWDKLPGPPRVVVTFPPLYCFTRNVGGDDVGVISVCKGVGPHDYQINAQEDVRPLRRADLFFVNGYDLDDPFAVQLKNNASNRNLKLVKVAEEAVPLSGDPPPIPVNKRATGHQHGDIDPHVWLGPPEAVRMVRVIRDKLKEVDPARAADYDRRAEEYIKRLEELQEEGKALRGPDGRRPAVIANHESLAYFARAFGLDIVGYIEAPGKDPGAGRLAELIKACEDHKVAIIAVEPQYPKKAAEALVRELKNRKLPCPAVVEVDPLETATDSDLSDLGWYERKMRANIDNLKKHLP